MSKAFFPPSLLGFPDFYLVVREIKMLLISYVGIWRASSLNLPKDRVMLFLTVTPRGGYHRLPTNVIRERRAKGS